MYVTDFVRNLMELDENDQTVTFLESFRSIRPKKKILPLKEFGNYFDQLLISN